MHKVSKALLLLSFSLLLIFNSCTNVFESSVDNTQENTQERPATPAEQPAAPAPFTAGISTFTFGGSIRVEGAVPSTIQQALANPDDSTSDPLESEAARSARPTLPAAGAGGNYEYYVRAYTDDGAPSVETIPQLVDGVYSYTMALELEHTWKFEAGFRRKAVGDVPARQLLVDYDSKRNSPFSLDLHHGSTDGYGETHTFILCPSQSENGKGSINLLMNLVGADYLEVTAVNEAGLAQQWNGNGNVTLVSPGSIGPGNWYIRSDGVNTTDSEATVHNLTSGTYELTLTFYKNYLFSGTNIPLPVFTTYQTINVFDNMTTDTWINENAGADANSLINPTTGAFTLSTDIVNQSIQTTLYVGVPDSVHALVPTLTASNSNEGAPFAPLASLDKAIQIIQLQGSSSRAYKIYLSGDSVGNFTIPEGVNSQASSIELMTAPGNSQTAALTGNGDTVLKVESTVPVTISKLQIRGGMGSEGKGGGINMSTGTKVTLGDGAVIGDANAAGVAHGEGNYSNYATYGGGIYCQGELLLKSGSKVCYNYTDGTGEYGGGGIYCDIGGTVTIQNGAEISKNGTGKHGGGIYYKDGTLKMSGSAKIADNDVWLADNKFITLTDLSNQNGTVTINSNWHRGVPVIKTETDSGLVIQNSPVENKFTYTTIAEDGWEPKFSANQITLSAPIFIGGDNESGEGTFSSPFKTISQANSLFDDPNCEYTIRIKGTTAAVQQELSGITKEANAKAIIIEGYGSDAVINRQAAAAATDGSALVINTNIPVKIKNLTIKGGYKDGNGGGIYVDNGASVELGDGTKIKGNKATNLGGGLYISHAPSGGTTYGIVCINGNVEIGNKDATSTSVGSTDLTTGANVAARGAGVYCAGYLNFGMYFNQEGTSTSGTDGIPTEVFICGNTATGTDSEKGGGGLFVDNYSNSRLNLKKQSNGTNAYHFNYNFAQAMGGGAIYLASQSSIDNDISLEIIGNKTLENGGGVFYASTTGITLPVNTAIKSNEAVNGGGIYLSTLIGQSITVQSKAIGGSNASDANTATGCGGAVYVKYLAPSSNLVYPLVLKDDAEIPPAYDSNGSCVNKNDVYLEWDETDSKLANIQVYGSTLNKEVAAAITPGNWKRGAVVLKSVGTMTQNLANKFKMSRDNVDWQKNLSSGTNPTTAYIMMPVYVASSAASDSTRKHCVAAPASGNTGTPSAPYSTIAAAISEAASSGADIVVDGKVTGAQSITSPGGNLNIRGFIDSDNGATESLASLDGNNTNGSRPLTIVADGRTITITDLKITGGRVGTAGGGGIYLSSGTLKLGDGAYVTGNSTSGNGGGVFVNSDTSLFMYGKSLIGDLGGATATSATLTESESTGCANTAKTGGGIYNNGGSVYIGYSSTTQKSDMDAGYGVRRNYASGESGQSAGGIMNRAGTLKIASGSVSYNKTANHGGGIYSVGTSATARGDVTIEAPEASANNLVMFGNNALIGGAVYIGSNCTLSMSAGQIGGNTSGQQNTATEKGGAIYQGEAFSVSGTACIYPGEKTVNDVFLPKKTDTKSLVVTANSDMGNNSELKMSLTPEEYKRGTRIVMKEGGSIGSTLGSNFALTTYDDDWSKQIETTSGAGYVIINSRIVVVGTESSGSTRPDDTWGWGSADGIGTKHSPYASIEDAINAGELGIAYNANTIYVAGTLKGVQSISGTDSTSLAKIPASLTINGIDSSTAIDGNSGGSALTVNASGKTITISNLKITGGSGSSMTVGGVAQTNGGGILLNAGTVKLSDGAVITGNAVANNGGGVYLSASGCALYMSGKALIGDSATSTTRASNAANNRANQAANGAGIYNNGGSVFIGSNASGTAATGYMLVNNDTDGHYGVRRNYSTTSGAGAGIYHAGGTLKIASGDISNNNAGMAGAGTCNGGGVYCAADVDISGGSFKNNYAANGGGLYIAAGKKATVNGAAVFTQNQSWVNGGAVYNLGEFTMSAGTIGGSNSSDANLAAGSAGLTSYGGAIYQEGTFNLSGSACVYPGSVKTNDVYLAYGKTVTIAGTLNPPSGVTSVATLTPDSYSRGRNILSSTSTNASYLSSAIGKIALSQDDTGWDRGNNISVTSETTKNVWITSPIYVVGASGTGSTKPEGFEYGVATGATGTKTSPYASVAAALTCADLATVKEITIAGTLVGAQQEISSPSVDITLKGYKASGETTSAAKIQRFSTRYTTNKTDGSALKVDASGKNVTITDLTITYGAALSGAGIYITAGTVKLGDYAKINDNYAANAGGGVYVNTGATLFMYGKALIGDKLSTEAGIKVAGTSGFDDYANRAQNSGGGGIYNGGAAYIGYSGFDTDGTTLIESSIDNGYGIIRNYNTNTGGGAIYNAGTLKIGSGSISYNQGNNGGAIKCTADATISGGTFTANKALYGGAICVDASKTVTIDGSATFTKNQASSSDGGAIYNVGTLTMSAGTIGESGALNTAGTSGGAIYQNGTFNISGTAYVYPGSEKSNDVYLPSNKKVTVDSTWSGSQASNKMTLTPSTWARGSQVLAGTKATDYYTYFNTSDSEWSVGYKESSWTLTDDLKTRIGADIYVAGSENRASGISAPSETASERIGTKLKPFNSIEEGVKACWNTTLPFTVKFSGTITGTAQTIPAGSTSTGGLASAITIEGVQGNSKDIINRNLSTATDSGTALTINTATPVTIKKIKITGGYNKNASGGGIRANVAGASLTLSEGALVTANNVTSSTTYDSGGGVYIEGTSTSPATFIMESDATISGNDSGQGSGGGVGLKYATLCMTGSALIGDKDATSAATGNSGKHSNSAQSGGGVYVGTGSKLRLGYATPTETTGTSLDAAYGIRYNYVYNAGGGVFVEAGSSVEIASGSISCNGTIANATYKNGGGIYLNETATLTMTGGTIAKNKAYDGGGVYLYGNTSTGSSIVMSGGTIGDSSSGVTSAATGSDEKFSNYAAHDGGGIYAATAKNTVTLNGGNVSYNYSAGQGGGIYTKTDTTFKANAKYNGAGGSGGGIYSASGTTLTMTTGTIYGNNSSVTSTDSSVQKNCGGGGVWFDGTFKLGGGTIQGNTAVWYGGGVGTANGTLYMYGSAVIGDSSKSAVPNASSTTSPTANRAKYGAGFAGTIAPGLYLGYSAGSWSGGTFSGTASSLASGGIYYNYASEHGGGIFYAGSSPLVIKTGNISYNKAAGTTGKGGGIYTESKLQMSGGTIAGNAGTNGGAVYLNNCVYEASGSIYIPYDSSSSSVHKENVVTMNGNSSKITVTGSLTYNNSKVMTVEPRAWTIGTLVADKGTSLASNTFKTAVGKIGIVKNRIYSKVEPIGSYSYPSDATKGVLGIDFSTVTESDILNYMSGKTWSLRSAEPYPSNELNYFFLCDKTTPNSKYAILKVINYNSMDVGYFYANSVLIGSTNQESSLATVNYSTEVSEIREYATWNPFKVTSPTYDDYIVVYKQDHSISMQLGSNYLGWYKAQ